MEYVKEDVDALGALSTALCVPAKNACTCDTVCSFASFMLIAMLRIMTD